MNKTKNPITRSYKKKKKKLFENEIDYFPFSLAHARAHLYLIHQTIRADVLHAQKEDEFAPNGVNSSTEAVNHPASK